MKESAMNYYCIKTSKNRSQKGNLCGSKNKGKQSMSLLFKEQKQKRPRCFFRIASCHW